ncbi:MAG: mercury(II) reductase [Spirochaetes bacterium]|nr:mercury(II) reductase [Spirochaetota bacterium]
MKTNDRLQKIELTIKGMTCDSCALHVTRELREVKGVVDVTVPGWKSGRATVVAGADTGNELLSEAVKKAGYSAKVLSRNDTGSLRKQKELKPGADYDLTVIGTGGGGMAAAIKAAELGRKVCIIEAGTVGGTCVNIGCVPSKALMWAAKIYHTADNHSFTGLHTRADGLEWSKVFKQKDNLVNELRNKKYIDVLSSYGDSITLLKGRARLHPDGTVALEDGRSIRSGRIIIATGARPRILPIDGIEDVEVLTSTTAMTLDTRPQSLIIIGGRAIALELGQIFARFGTEVTILQRSRHIIPDQEPDIAEALKEYLKEDGLNIYTGAKPLRIRQEDKEKIITAEVNGKQKEFRAEQVLMAAGREPNTMDLGLGESGVKVDERGFISVDEYMQTSNPNIYASGDVTSLPKLVYVAAAGGTIAAENSINGNTGKLDLSVLPVVIFTDPQFASVGLTEAQAAAEGFDVKVAELPLSYVPRALTARDTRGMIKLIADRKSDRLLGAHVLAAEAGEVIQTATMAIKFGIRYGFTVNELSGTLFPYLTQVEGLKLAAQTFEKDISQLSCCAG